MKVTICTQVLDWNFGLREALPTWLNFPCDEIVIFDFNSGKESAKEIVDLYPDPRIKLFVPVSPMKYNQAIGANVVVNATSGDLIFRIDADVKILKPFDLTDLKQNEFIQGCKDYGHAPQNPEYPTTYPYIENGVNIGNYWTSLAGSSIFWREQYLRVNGYDERMSGWGFFDCDFYIRLLSKGYIRKDFPIYTLQHVDHSNMERTKNYEVKDIKATNLANMGIAGNPWGPHLQQRDVAIVKG